MKMALHPVFRWWVCLISELFPNYFINSKLKARNEDGNTKRIVVYYIKQLQISDAVA